MAKTKKLTEEEMKLRLKEQEDKLTKSIQKLVNKMIFGTNSKVCSICTLRKPDIEFSRQKNRRRDYCKQCQKQLNKQSYNKVMIAKGKELLNKYTVDEITQLKSDFEEGQTNTFEEFTKPQIKQIKAYFQSF